MIEPAHTVEEYLQITTLRLQLAYQYGMGQIVFVIFSDEAIRADFEAELVARIAPQRVRRMRFYPDDPPEAAGLLYGRLGLNPPDADQVVFVYDVRYGFPGLFNSLNYQRELIPEQGWRLVFWTSNDEVVAIMRNAPDFWAFVHGSVDLPHGEPEKEPAFIDELADKYLEWEDTFADYSNEERQARINLREGYFLARLPHDIIPPRQYYHYIVGILYFYQKQLQQAETHLQKAAEMALLMEDKEKQVQSYNRLGTLYTALHKHDDAISAYQHAISLNPSFAPAHYNLAKLYQQLGHDNDAHTAYQRAADLIRASKTPLLSR